MAVLKNRLQPLLSDNGDIKDTYTYTLQVATYFHYHREHDCNFTSFMAFLESFCLDTAV